MNIDLLSYQDLKYKEFNQKIVTTKYEVIGIRMPVLKGLANKIYQDDYRTFLASDNAYYETVMLKCLVVAKIKDLDEFMQYFYNIVSLIDNWALSDAFVSGIKIVGKNKNYF